MGKIVKKVEEMARDKMGIDEMGINQACANNVRPRSDTTE